MKWIVLLFVGAAIIVSCAAQDETPTVDPTGKTNGTTDPPTKPTTLPTVTTTHQANTTTQHTTTTTTPHNPNTTTQHTTTTTPHNPNTTTQHPSTTTTPAPATTTATPPVKQGSWEVYSANKTSICILFKAAVEFDIPKQSSSHGDARVVVPTTANASGSCDPKEQSITLTWDSAVKGSHNLVKFVFSQNKTAKTSEVSHIMAFLEVGKDEARALDADSRMNLTASPSGFAIAINDSYKCTAKETIKMSMNATLFLSSVQFQAFRTANTTKFGTAAVCEADKKSTSDIVPIAVGCALAALVVIILIAYLIGRRRSRQKGYQSV